MTHTLRYIALMLFLLLGWADASTLPVAERASSVIAQMVNEQHPDERSDRLTDLSKQQDRQAAATLSDARSLSRICNTRPQRVLQSFSSKTRTWTRFVLPFKYYKPLFPVSDREEIAFTATSIGPASCSYYVIALRHILR